MNIAATPFSGDNSLFVRRLIELLGPAHPKGAPVLLCRGERQEAGFRPGALDGGRREKNHPQEAAPMRPGPSDSRETALQQLLEHVFAKKGFGWRFVPEGLERRWL